MVGQKQPQGHVKREDEGSPQTRSKQRRCQDSPKPVVLSTPGGVRENRPGSPGLRRPSPPTPPSPCSSQRPLTLVF